MGTDLRLLLDSFDPKREVPVIIRFSDKVDLQCFKDRKSSLRRFKLINALKSKAQRTQQALIADLTARGVKPVISLWIINGLAARIPVDLILSMATYPGIESIRLDYTLFAPETTISTSALPAWNLEAVRATEIWDLGFTGQGIVVANMDTGADFNHPDLAGRWRGGTNSWFDPYEEHDMPYDPDGHGTQTLGIMVGGDAGGTAIGVAPGLQWIAVKIFNDDGVASLSAIHQGYQWLLDPDENTTTDDTPDIVNNSWGLESNVGTCILEFQDDIQVLRRAEIAVVAAAGNQGPGTHTSLSPANYPESLAVGAIDDAYAVPFFSSSGPSACDDGIYPDLVAPGVDIRTSDVTIGGLFPDSYSNVWGTSFASAHVAGAMALLFSAFPGATVTDLESALKESAMDLGTPGPDNAAGYGLLDIVAAYNLLRQGQPVCTDEDSDGYYVEPYCGLLQDCNDTDATLYPGSLEVKHDGVDQDCNGYDLTIEIIRAIYFPKIHILSVVATSALEDEANLELVDYGPMQWISQKSKWVTMIKLGGDVQETITVVGIEGQESREIDVCSIREGFVKDGLAKFF